MVTKNKMKEVNLKKRPKKAKPVRKDSPKELPFNFSFVTLKTKELDPNDKKSVMSKVRAQVEADETWNYFDEVPAKRGHSVLRIESSKTTGKVGCVYEVAYDAAKKSEDPRYETSAGRGWVWLSKGS